MKLPNNLADWESNNMHTPVLIQEILSLLNPRPGQCVLDGTVGSGGHAIELLKRILPDGKLLAVDADRYSILTAERALVAAFGREVVDRHVVFENDTYAQAARTISRRGFPLVHAALLDLGFSSDQISSTDRPPRGFSFLSDEPLLMTYNDETRAVRDFLPELSATDLTKILREFGEERYAAKIAGVIKDRERIKPFLTTRDLAEAVTAAVPSHYAHGRIHPATRTFMALRIYANQELSQLKLFLTDVSLIVTQGGRVGIISFHSLEDRIVKRGFLELAREGRARVVTKRPTVASDEEVIHNPRARSAKLRVAELSQIAS